MLPIHSSDTRTPAPPDTPRFTKFISWLAWSALLIVTLGFSQKYRERLYDFEPFDPGYLDDSYEPYSIPPGYQDFSHDQQTPSVECRSRGLEPTQVGEIDIENVLRKIAYGRVRSDANLRSRQGDEWDRLGTATSVITATSAAALAIPGLAGPGSYWVVNTCFYAALGISIEGLILVFYIQVMAAGASNETIGRLARGRVVFFGMELSPRLPALIMGLPVVFATYSSLFLLSGTIAMVTTASWGPIMHFPGPCNHLSLLPIGFGLVCMCGAVVVCEAGAYHERRIRRRNAEIWRNKPKSLLSRAVHIGVAAAMLPLEQPRRAHAISTSRSDGLNHREPGPEQIA